MMTSSSALNEEVFIPGCVGVVVDVKGGFNADDVGDRGAAATASREMLHSSTHRICRSNRGDTVATNFIFGAFLISSM
jgi:hypothetical protein